MATTRLWAETPNHGLDEDVPLERLPDLLHDTSNLLWLDICDPGPPELELLRDAFGFHELALEDVRNGNQRPKCDTYHDYYFIVVYAAAHTHDRFVPLELQMFWGERYVATIHHTDLPLLEVARRQWRAYDQRRQHGVGYLVYCLLDSLVDDYFPLQDWMAEMVEDIEDEIIERPDQAVLTELFQLRKGLLEIRRRLAPTRDVVNEIIRRDLPLYPQSLHPYFSDVYDHALRVLDGIDVYRDLLASALDLHLSAVSNRLNQTMKRMTALTLIVMVPTLIAGIYGMNFERSFWPDPEWRFGFYAIVAVMGLLVLAGLAIARRLDWL
jgi:magnesium transporter